MVTVSGVLMLDAREQPRGEGERGFREDPDAEMHIVGSVEHPLVIAKARAR